jgi:hypothetical protein
MGAIKPFHVLALFCCLVPLAIGVAGALWYATRRK